MDCFILFYYPIRTSSLLFIEHFFYYRILGEMGFYISCIIFTSVAYSYEKMFLWFLNIFGAICIEILYERFFDPLASPHTQTHPVLPLASKKHKELNNQVLEWKEKYFLDVMHLP